MLNYFRLQRNYLLERLPINFFLKLFKKLFVEYKIYITFALAITK